MTVYDLFELSDVVLKRAQHLARRETEQEIRAKLTEIAEQRRKWPELLPSSLQLYRTELNDFGLVVHREALS